MSRVTTTTPLIDLIDYIECIDCRVHRLVMGDGRTRTHRGTASFGSSVVNVVNTTLGAGTLSLPFVYGATGLGLASFLILLSATAAGLCILLLVHAIHASRSPGTSPSPHTASPNTPLLAHKLLHPETPLRLETPHSDDDDHDDDHDDYHNDGNNGFDGFARSTSGSSGNDSFMDDLPEVSGLGGGGGLGDEYVPDMLAARASLRSADGRLDGVEEVGEDGRTVGQDGCEYMAVTYQGLGRLYFGPRVAYVLDVLMAIDTWSSVLSYVIVIGDLLPGTLRSWFRTSDGNVVTHRAFVMSAVSLLVILPLSLLRKLDALRFTSGAALVCMLYLAGVIIHAAFDSEFDDRVAGNVNSKDISGSAHPYWLRLNGSVLFVFPIVTFAFTSHIQIPSLFAEARTRRVSSFMKIATASIAICIMFYMVVGVFAFLSFYNAVDGNVFNNFTDDDDVFIGAAKVALALTLTFSTPLFVHPLREIITSLIYPRTPPPDSSTRHILITIAIVLFSLGMGIAIPNVEDVFALSGGTTGTISVYVAPTAFFLASAAKTPNRYNTSPLYRSLAWSLMVFGSLVGLAATTTVILDLTGVVSAK